MMAIATNALRGIQAQGAALRPRLLSLARVIRRVERRPRLWLLVSALILALQISPWWYSTADGTLYVLMARSHVAAGPSGNPDSTGDTARGYSLLISPAFLLGDRPFLALSVIHWLFAVAMVLGVYQWGRQLAPRAAIWIALLTAANAAVCYYYRRTLKEIVFLAAVIWTINALHALLRSDTGTRLLRRLAVAVALLSATVLIRYSAVVLVPGFVLSVLLSRRPELAGRRRVVAGAIALLAAVGFGFILFHEGQSYFVAFRVGFADTAATISEGLRLRIGAIVRICAPGMFKAYGRPHEWLDWNIALGVLLLVLVAVGWFRAAVRRRDPLILAFPLYAGLYMIWPFDQGARFMVSMVPVLIACFWFGMARLPRVRSLFLAGCFAAHVSAMLGYWLLIDAPRAAEWHGRWNSIERLAARIDPAQGAVVCADAPNEARQMLIVCLGDRRAIVPDSIGRDSERVGWVFQARAAVAPRGWDRVASAGGFELLRRSRATTAGIDLVPDVNRR
jgi:hypothetical protein